MPIHSAARAAAFSLFLALGALAQPQISAITNAADFTPTLSPGSIASIFGTGLAPSAAPATTVPLLTTLNSVTVNVNGKAAPLFYVSPMQINFQVPYSTATGIASLTVTSNNTRSAARQFVVAAYSPGIFQYGSGHGVIQNQDYSVNAPNNPAASGTYIIVYITGLGVTSTAVPDGDATPSSPLSQFKGMASATIGDAPATVIFAGLTPGFIGLAQMNILVPDLPSGDYPLYLALNGYQYVSATVSVNGAVPAPFLPSSLLTLVSSFSLPGVGTTVVQTISGLVANSVAYYNNTLYVCSAADIKVVDVTNPAAPNFIKVINDPGLGSSAHNCAVNLSAPLPLLVDIVRETQSIPVYDLTDPQSPAKRSQRSVSIVPRSLAFSGSTAFLGEDLFSYSGHTVYFTEGNILSVNFSNLTAPTAGPLVASSTGHPETNHGNIRPYMLAPAPNLLYVASTTASQSFDNGGVGALDIFNVADPTNIQGAGQILVPGTKVLLTLATQGTEMLVAGDTRGYSPGNELSNGEIDFPFAGFLTLTMFDITNTVQPKMQGNVIIPSMQPANVGGPVSLGSVALGGGFFALTCAAPDPTANGGSPNGSLVIVDARDPQNPKAYTYGTLSGLGGLTVANGYLYAAMGSGASVFKINLP